MTNNPKLDFPASREHFSANMYANAISRVRTTQGGICEAGRNRNLFECINRDTWQTASTVLSWKYFEKDMDKGNTASRQIHDLYLAAMAIGPLFKQCPSYWRWNAFRNTFTKKIYSNCEWGRHTVNVVPLDYDDVDLRVGKALESVGVRDDAFMDFCSGLVLNNIYNDSLRGQLARMVFGPVFYRDLAVELGNPYKSNGVGLFWYEDAIILFSKHGLGVGEQVDIRKNSVELLGYDIRLGKKRGAKPKIRLDSDLLDQARQEIKDILIESKSAKNRIGRASKVLFGLYCVAKFAPHAQRQCRELDTWAFNRIQNTIIKSLPRESRNSHTAMIFRIGQQPWVNPTKARSVLLYDPTQTDQENWVKAHNPRR